MPTININVTNDLYNNEKFLRLRRNREASKVFDGLMKSYLKIKNGDFDELAKIADLEMKQQHQAAELTRTQKQLEGLKKKKEEEAKYIEIT